MKGLVEALNVIQFLCQRVAQEYPAVNIQSRVGQSALQISDVVGVGGLHPQLRAQQQARIFPVIDRDRAFAGFLSFLEPAETPFAARQVVPGTRPSRFEVDGATIQRIRLFVTAKLRRHIGEAVIRLRGTGSQLHRSIDDIACVPGAPQLEQQRGQEAVAGNAHRGLCHRAFGQRQRLGQTAGAHQPQGFRIYRGSHQYIVALIFAVCHSVPAAAAIHDVVIRNGMIYDGSGRPPFAGDVAIDGDRIVYVGPHRALTARKSIDARGRAVSPGFIDMMGHSEESLLIDGRAVSGLEQGVTMDVFTEASKGPLTPEMARLMTSREGDLKYEVTWKTLGGYLDHLQSKGIAPNVGSFVGEGEVRVNVLGEGNVTPSDSQLDTMGGLVRHAMEEGALGLTTALIYAPMNYAKTPELIAMTREAARCGGIYTAHMRSEGDHIENAVQETIAIARASGAPAEIHHLKLMGRDNWNKLDRVVHLIEGARASGIRITADMYVYTAGGTASTPPCRPGFTMAARRP